MSGMALGTVVVEAGDRSGALITAHHALDQNREVFAVPGSVLSPSSFGANRLIMRSGAKLVSDYEDILEELNLSWAGKQLEMEALFPANESESKILDYVTHEPLPHRRDHPWLRAGHLHGQQRARDDGVEGTD